MQDYVKCLNCSWQGLVSIETDTCPTCNRDCLTFVDEIFTTYEEFVNEYRLEKFNRKVVN